MTVYNSVAVYTGVGTKCAIRHARQSVRAWLPHSDSQVAPRVLPPITLTLRRVRGADRQPVRLDVVLVESLVADAFGTNCFVMATGPGEQCVVIDPGIGIAARLLSGARRRPDGAGGCVHSKCWRTLGATVKDELCLLTELELSLIVSETGPSAL